MGICMEKYLVAALAGGFYRILEQSGRNRPMSVCAVYEKAVNARISIRRISKTDSHQRTLQVCAMVAYPFLQPSDIPYCKTFSVQHAVMLSLQRFQLGGVRSYQHYIGSRFPGVVVSLGAEYHGQRDVLFHPKGILQGEPAL